MYTLMGVLCSQPFLGRVTKMMTLAVGGAFNGPPKFSPNEATEVYVYVCDFLTTPCPLKKFEVCFFGNFSAQTWPNSKSKVSFENYRF